MAMDVNNAINNNNNNDMDIDGVVKVCTLNYSPINFNAFFFLFIKLVHLCLRIR